MIKAKKHILFIDGPLNGGGAERVLIDVLRNIDYSHYDVDLAVICPGGRLMDEVPAEVNVIHLWKGYNFAYRFGLMVSRKLRCNALLSGVMNGPKLRRDYDIEISFLEGMPLKLGALRTTAAKKATWVHADLFNSPYEKIVFYPGEELRAYNAMDTIVHVSADSESGFRRRFPDCKTPMTVIYNPIDRAKIEQLANESVVDRDPDVVTVTAVGRLTSQKNPERFLRVARMAHDAGLRVRFRWIGDGELRPSLTELRDSMGLTGTVEFTGFVSNPFPLLKGADILMSTSDAEGFGLVICEAMCLGVPVISTRTSGPSEIIGDNQFGLLTEFTDESVFEALEKLVNDESLRKELAKRASTRPDDFSVEKTLSRLDDLINS